MLPAFGLYTHIRANRVRSRVLLAGLFVLVLVLAFGIALLMRGWSGELPAGYPDGVGSYVRAAWHDLVWLGPLAIAGAGIWIAVAYRVHQALIDRVTGSDEASRDTHPRLYELVENLCIARGMTVPRLRAMESEALNAFATGLKPEQYAITVTTGLLAALDEAELEAVLAHELTHIRNDDVRTMMIAVVVAGILSFAGEMMARGPRSISFGGGSGKKKGGAAAAILIAVVIMLVVWLLSQVIKFALSRSREYLADAGAAELTKNPDAMINALVKIRGRGELVGVPSGVMELCVDNPRSGFADLFATHPAIDDRIAALGRFAGGRVPPVPDAVDTSEAGMVAGPSLAGAPDPSEPLRSPAARDTIITSAPGMFVPPPSPGR
ncbi:M48 family metallopeptidase [uncultured Enterovirga sp.]|uniref:M48 family metallopeptidase n=1 Tax=uncultured Enterovirga sp. TaxID=2026352 RepID=UPI0035C9693E